MKKDTSIILGIMGVVIVVVVWLIAAGSHNGTAATSSASDALAPTKGPANAKVHLVEYGDFQCPACAGAVSIIHTLTAAYPDSLQLSFMHFPLSQHQNAFAAAVTAEIAKENGHFWEMYDMLYANQQSWENSPNALAIFKDFATVVGVDKAKYQQAVANPSKYQTRVRDNQQKGTNLQISGTPTFFINDKIYTGEITLKGLKEQIDTAMHMQ